LQIPKTVRIGSLDYDIVQVNHCLCVNQKESKGVITYSQQLIELRNNCQATQSMEQTLLHEIVHAMARDRGLDWGDNDELYTEELAKALHQLIRDNPDLFK
jgi:hypothetical protein